MENEIKNSLVSNWFHLFLRGFYGLVLRSTNDGAGRKKNSTTKITRQNYISVDFSRVFFFYYLYSPCYLCQPLVSTEMLICVDPAKRITAALFIMLHVLRWRKIGQRTFPPASGDRNWQPSVHTAVDSDLTPQPLKPDWPVHWFRYQDPTRSSCLVLDCTWRTESRPDLDPFQQKQ